MGLAAPHCNPAPPGPKGNSWGCLGSLWPCQWQSRGQNEQKVYPGKKSGFNVLIAVETACCTYAPNSCCCVEPCRGAKTPRVIFDDEGSYIEDKSSGERMYLEDRGGMFMLKVWVRSASKPQGF